MTANGIVEIIQALGPFLGILAGSLISSLTTLISNRHTLVSEEKQWEREQEAKAHEERLEQERTRREELIQAYHQSMKCLSQLSRFRSNSGDDCSEFEQLWNESLDHVNRLVILKSDLPQESRSELHTYAGYLGNGIHFADSLLGIVTALAMEDQIISPHAKIELEEVSEPEDSTIRTVEIVISDHFRRDALIAGQEISRSYTFQIPLSQMTATQREKLCDVFFSSSQSIPRRFDLTVPSLHRQGKTIEFRSQKWRACFDAPSKEPLEILQQWEIDFSEALSKAKSQLDDKRDDAEKEK